MRTLMAAEPERPADTTGILVSLATACPTCGKGEARRVPKWRLEMYRDLNPDRVVETVTCGKCRTQYEVYAKAYQRAG